jgi:hypothetical protein
MLSVSIPVARGFKHCTLGLQRLTSPSILNLKSNLKFYAGSTVYVP